MSDWLDAIRTRTEQALASGDLSPLQTSEEVLQDGGLNFILRWADSLAAKDAAPTILPGGPRDPNFNPFLPPDPALTAGHIGTTHTVILNKFPVCLHHVVLARQAFAEQLTPLELCDFEATTTLLSLYGGLGFYNGGAPAGASQRHKHTQWLPESDGNASLRQLAGTISAPDAENQPCRHPALDFAHVMYQVPVGRGVDAKQSAQALFEAYGRGLAYLKLAPGEDGLLPPHNLLMGDGWLLMLRRSQEHFEGVSMNALSFGGTIYVRQPEQVELIRKHGALAALRSVAN